VANCHLIMSGVDLNLDVIMSVDLTPIFIILVAMISFLSPQLGDLFGL